MTVQPSGTVTLLFTDVEGSTRLLERLGPERYADTLELHRRLLRDAFERHDGYEVDSEGDAFFVAFASASDAVAAAAEAQQAIARAEWPARSELRVRMGIHSGEPLVAPPKYVGLDVHRAARIMAAAHGGQVLLSAATRRATAGLEVRPLGEHRLKDLLQPEPLYQLHIEGLPAEFPALQTLGNRPTNLPVQPNPLIGREEEIGEVIALLSDPAARMVTLTGPGGIGKTRLALQIAAELLDAFASGVFVVQLAPVADPELVIAAVADALAVREEPGRELPDTLASYLEGREMLLVLDNFEQVVEAAFDVTRLLHGAARLRVLITSRERLRVGGEQVYPVPPLRLPPERSDIAALASTEAVVLFVSRAHAATGAFSLSEENAAAVAGICRRLEGLPLAIELAAARSSALPPGVLLERLERRLPLLTTGARDADERQRTLRGTIKWSYDLLGPQEQTLFTRLAVFADGCRIEAAEAVCNVDHDLAVEPLDGLSALVEKSLLRRRTDPDGEPRFWMLETIHEFAEELLTQAPDRPRLQDRHADWVLATVASGGENAVNELAREHENLRTALRWCLDTGRADDVLDCVDKLFAYWDLRGQWLEGRRWLAELARQSGDNRRKARAIGFEAELANWQGDLAGARALSAEALRVAESVGDESLLARLYDTAGLVAANGGQVADARAMYERALRFADARDVAFKAKVSGHLAYTAVCEGDFTRAATLAREVLAIEPASTRTKTAGVALQNLGLSLLLTGDIDGAREAALGEVRLFHDIASPVGLMYGLELLAAVAAREGNHERAAVLLGAGARLRDDTQFPLEPVELSVHEKTLLEVREALGDEHSERALETGRSLDFEAGSVYALAEDRRVTQ